MCISKIILFLVLLLLISIIDYVYSYQKPRDGYNTFTDTSTILPPFNSLINPRWGEPYFDISVSNNITSLTGKSAYLGCRARNVGNKTVSWIRHRDLHILTVGTYTYTNDQRFQTTHHHDINEWTLQIKWAQSRDAGMYECQISTQPVKSFSVQLNVVVPTASILGGPDLYVHKGSTINLTCIIRYSPEPPGFLFWYHEDKVMSNYDGIQRTSITHLNLDEMSISYLLINDADLPDSGNYTCDPSNARNITIRVHVLIGERPEAMQTGTSAIYSQQHAHILLAVCVILNIFRNLFWPHYNLKLKTHNNNNNSKNNNKNNHNDKNNSNINNHKRNRKSINSNQQIEQSTKKSPSMLADVQQKQRQLQQQQQQQQIQHTKHKPFKIQR